MTPAQLAMLAKGHQRYNDPDGAKNDNKPKGLRAFQEMTQ